AARQASLAAAPSDVGRVSFDRCAHHLTLHSFPTRRSSDLAVADEAEVVLVAHHLARALEAVLLDDVLPEGEAEMVGIDGERGLLDRKSTRLNSSHDQISYAVFCLKKKRRKVTSSM